VAVYKLVLLTVQLRQELQIHAQLLLSVSLFLVAFSVINAVVLLVVAGPVRYIFVVFVKYQRGFLITQELIQFVYHLVFVLQIVVRYVMVLVFAPAVLLRVMEFIWLLAQFLVCLRAQLA